jgi:hypothetical protein
MKLFNKHSVTIFLFIFVFVSCTQKEEFPIEPSIEYVSFLKIYNPSQELFDRGVLKISFKDGDGDIGLHDYETQEPYDYNFIITYFEIQNGEEVEVIPSWYNPLTDSIEYFNFNARIPILTPSGANKSIKGEIEDTLFIYNYSSPYDTIRFEAYILDRALHQSNTVSTPWFIR